MASLPAEIPPETVATARNIVSGTRPENPRAAAPAPALHRQRVEEMAEYSASRPPRCSRRRLGNLLGCLLWQLLARMLAASLPSNAGSPNGESAAVQIA